MQIFVPAPDLDPADFPLPPRRPERSREEPRRLQQTFPSRGAGKLRFSTFKGLKTRVFSLKSTAAAFPVSFRHQIWNRKQYYNRRKCYFRIGNSSKHFKSRQKNSILVSLKSLFQNVWRVPPYFLHRISASHAFPNDRLLESWTKKIKRSLIKPLFNQTLKVKFSWVRLRVNV